MKKTVSTPAATEIQLARTRAGYSFVEVCESLGICRAALYKRIADGTGPRVMKIGKSVRVSHQALQDWIQSCEGGK